MELAALFDLILSNDIRTVSFVGCGGKTSLLLATFRQLTSAGKRVLGTTTTKVGRSATIETFTLVDQAMDGDWKEVVKEVQGEGGLPFVHKGGGLDTRLSGISPDSVKEMDDLADVVLIEADGGRGRPLKRVRDHEPVLSVDVGPGLVVIVVGVDALGRPLDDGSCFNYEGVIRDGIGAKGDIIDPELIRNILYSPRGYLEAIPAGHEAVVVINKADETEAQNNAEVLGRVLFDQRVGHLFISTTMPTDGNGPRMFEIDNRSDKVTGVVLAAGVASRYGSNKLLEMIDGTSMVRKVVTNALGCKGFDKVVLVLGHDIDDVKGSLGDVLDEKRLEVVVNDRYIDGMGSSLRVGLDSCMEGGCDAVAVLLGDMPLIGAQDIEKVVGAYRSSFCMLCVPRVDGRWGHPVIIRKDLFEAVKKVQGDVGAREIVKENIERALTVDLGERAGLDIDTVKQYEDFLGGRGGDRRA